MVTLFVTTLSLPGWALCLELDFGARVGVSLSRPTVQDADSFAVSGRPRLSGGGFVSIQLTEAFAIQPEALVTGKSFSSEGFVTDSPIESTWLELPVAIAFSLPWSGSVEPELLAGIQIGVLLTATREFQGIKQDIKNELKETEMGLLFGGRVRLGAARRFSLEGRLQWGLTNLDDTNWFTIRSRSFYVLFGYRF